jgi:tRNA modification GTPase
MLNTIVALATPPVKGALAIIRISGDKSIDIINSIFSRKVEKNHYAYYGYIINSDGEKVDEVITTLFKGPHSFTGEDVVEISCHGSMLIANEIIELILSKGAVLAGRGEFSSRAFYNGRIDLVQAESINELINAESKEAKKLQLYSLTGETSKLLTPLQTTLADILSLIEVNIDYPEYEDIEVETNEKLLTKIDPLIDEINYLINNGESSKLVVDGISVALVGRPNVGKSSLLNALIKQDKAIVTNIPGTTRDVVEGKIRLNGLTLNLLDTAGIRDASNEVEKIGIEKSRKSIEQADLVILVLEANKFTDEDQELMDLTKDKKRIIVYNKKELINKEDYKEGQVYISALNKDTKELETAISKLFNLSELEDLTPALVSSREIGLLLKVKENLIEAKKEAQDGISLDLISMSLKAAYDTTKEILGQEITVDLEQEIFSRFCLGK